MLNDTLQMYLLMIFKLTHIPIEFRDKIYTFSLKNNHNIAFPVQLLRVGRPYFPKFKIFSIRS